MKYSPIGLFEAVANLISILDQAKMQNFIKAKLFQ